MSWEADHQSWAGNVWTCTGSGEVHYRDYILRADKVVYHQSTTELEAEGNLQVAGGPNDILINADHGDMRLNMHTARFFNVHGSQGVRDAGPHDGLFHDRTRSFFPRGCCCRPARADYRIIDGTMTNCRLPKPDWQLYLAHHQTAKTARLDHQCVLQVSRRTHLFICPICAIRRTRRGARAALLTPVVSNWSSIRDYTFWASRFTG